MMFCLHWEFIPGDRDSDPCYQLFIQNSKGKLANTGYVIQDCSAYSKDPEPFVIYQPRKTKIIGEKAVAAVEKANALSQATVVAVLLATGAIK